MTYNVLFGLGCEAELVVNRVVSTVRVVEDNTDAA